MSDKTKILIMQLECKLTEKEQKDYSKKLAEEIAKNVRLENEMAQFRAQKKAEQETIEAAINDFSQKVASEKEFRAVEVEVNYFYKDGTKHFIRKDTGEDFKTEVLQEFERQQELPIEEKPEEPAPEAKKKKKKAAKKAKAETPKE